MIIRAAGDGLKDEEDDHAFQKLVGDVQRVRQELASTDADVTTAAAAAAAASALAATKATSADITTAVAAHVALANPHSQYLLATSYTAITASINTISSGTQTVNAGVNNTTITSYSAIGTATLSGMDVSTGIFTVPSTGLYLVTVYVQPYVVTLAAGQQWHFYVDRNNASAADLTFGRFEPYNYNSAGAGPWAGISGARFLTANDTLRVRISNVGANQLTVLEAHFNIIKLA